jgi:multidrug efflux pump subunit AcrA (membrane-fusion protein)
LEDDVRLEYVIRVEQQTAAQAAAQARTDAAQAHQEAMEAAAQAREAAAEARAQAQEDAARAREDAQRIRDEIRTRIREQIRGPQPEVVVAQGTPFPPWEQHMIPPQVVDIVTMFLVAMVICVVGFPIARAFGRWIDRRGLPTPVNTELSAQITRIEHAVDSMSVEVERISEAQRFQAKLLSDREKVRA